ncbi:MAG: hypothetical protein MZU79_01890 [Anaerotruncus sp.]|nr:hypothetical protein [Anaerotruncus sp.]
MNGRKALRHPRRRRRRHTSRQHLRVRAGLIPEGEFQAQGISGSQEFAFVPVDSYEVAGAVLRASCRAVPAPSGKPSFPQPV